MDPSVGYRRENGRPEEATAELEVNNNTYSPPPTVKLVFDPLMKKLFSPDHLYVCKRKNLTNI